MVQIIVRTGSAQRFFVHASKMCTTCSIKEFSLKIIQELPAMLRRLQSFMARFRQTSRNRAFQRRGNGQNRLPCSLYVTTARNHVRSEEHTSELQSLMRIS